MQTSKKRMWFYAVVLVLLGLLAWWTFVDGDDLKKLKETELVTEGIEEPVALVEKTVKLVDGKQRQKVFALMASRDGIEFGRVWEVLSGEVMGPVEVLGCRRLKKSSQSGNISIYVRSVGRDKMYLFHLLKDRKGEYRIYDVEVTEKGPETED